jgi:hypothetical protein
MVPVPNAMPGKMRKGKRASTIFSHHTSGMMKVYVRYRRVCRIAARLPSNLDRVSGGRLEALVESSPDKNSFFDLQFVVSLYCHPQIGKNFHLIFIVGLLSRSMTTP